MAPNRDSDDHSDGDNSHARIPRHNHRRSKQDHPDKVNGSIDSGYGGSSAAASPRLHLGGLPRGEQAVPPPQQVHATPGQEEGIYSHDDGGKRAGGSGTDSESDSDYDPRSKYSIKVDDDAYRDISFQSTTGEHTGKEQQFDRSSRENARRREPQDDYTTRQPRSSHVHDHHRRPSHRGRSGSRSRASSESSESGSSRRHDSRRRQPGPRHYSDTSGARSRRDSRRSHRSEVPFELTARHTGRNRSRTSSRRRAARAHTSDSEDTDAEREAEEPDRRPRHDRRRRHRSLTGAKQRTPSPGCSRKPRSGRSISEQQQFHTKGAADMDEAWYKSVKERLTKGVDMNQVKKVGFEAAAVAAVKVAVGTQTPWAQRIPKMVAVGLAAAVTDFVVSRTSMRPKGMVGNMFARQLVEIALANLLVNPVSNKVTVAARKAMGRGGDGGGRTRHGTKDMKRM